MGRKRRRQAPRSDRSRDRTGHHRNHAGQRGGRQQGGGRREEGVQDLVAILGLGAIVKRPMVVKGADGGETIAIRSMVYLALSYDHRVVDGADAARFLATLKERLEEGRFESDLGL